MKIARDLAILFTLVLVFTALRVAPLLAKSRPSVTEAVTASGCSTSELGGGYCVAIVPLTHPLPNDHYAVSCTGAPVTLAEPLSRFAFLVVMVSRGLQPGPGYGQDKDTNLPRYVSYAPILDCAVTHRK